MENNQENRPKPKPSEKHKFEKPLDAVTEIRALAKKGGAFTPEEIARGHAATNFLSTQGHRYDNLLILTQSMLPSMTEATDTDKKSSSGLLNLSTSRRSILKLGAFGTALVAGKIVAGNINTNSRPTPIPARIIPKIPQQNQSHPEILKPKSSTACAGKFNGQKVDITGYGTTGNFLIKTPNGITQAPIEQVSVTSEIGPLKEVYQRSFIGFNVDFHDAKSIRKAVELGAGAVRIDAAQGLDQDLTAARDTIAEAMKYGLKINIIFRPQQLEDEQTILTRIQGLFEIIGDYPNISIELGNEPDDTKTDFFFGNREKMQGMTREEINAYKTSPDNLKDFATVVARSIQAIRQQENGKNTKIIMGAIVHPELTGKYLQYLQEEGINLSDYEYAIHPYWTITELEDKFKTISDELKKRGVTNPLILATEIGSKNKKNLFTMLRRAKELGIKEADIYTLVENPGEMGFGVLSPTPNPSGEYIPEPSFYLLQQNIQQDTTLSSPNDHLIHLQ